MMIAKQSIQILTSLREQKAVVFQACGKLEFVLVYDECNR
jgi:hypothetical protein